jgi:hypothetical protein
MNVKGFESLRAKWGAQGHRDRFDKMNTPGPSMRLPAVAIGLSLIGFLILADAAEPKGAATMSRKEVAQEIMSKWETLPYVAISNTPAFADAIRQFPVTYDGGLTQLQTNTLPDALFRFVMAYHVGSYDAFRRFRTPPGAPVKFSPAKIKYIARGWMNQNGTGSTPLSSNEEMYRWFVRHHGGAAFYRGYYWREFYLGYWQGLCVDAGQVDAAVMDGVSFKGKTNLFGIHAQTVTNLPPDWDGGFLLHNSINLGVSHGAGFFDFERSPETTLKEEKQLTVATVNWLVKPRKPDPPFPVFLRLYWDSTSTNWLPMDMAAGNLWMATEISYGF